MSKRNSLAPAPKQGTQQLVPVGEIVGTHGIQGWLKLKPYNPKTAGLSLIRKVSLEKGGTHSHHRLQAFKGHKGHILIKLEGTDGINEAEKWVSATLSVAEDSLQPLNPGEYYYYQVLGLDVYNAQGEWVGILTRIWSKRGGDLYVVKGTSKEYLIPAVKEMIEKIDLPARKIIINLPPGLLEL